MQDAIHELRQITADFSALLKGIAESDFSNKPLPDKWSKKEIIGHLIDSAQNNLRRFICAQYESTPPKIVYQQNFWVSACQYQHMPSQNVIELWVLINQQIISVLLSMPSEKYSAQCETSELRTLEWLAVDYIRHMKHHLNQVIPESLEIRNT